MSEKSSGGSGSICGFTQDTEITCTAQAKNSAGLGTKVQEDISTLNTVTQSENNCKLQYFNTAIQVVDNFFVLLAQTVA